jgi:molybdenum cofactor cytidylyltransferase
VFDCVILAAGSATRFGSCKLLANYCGRPLVTYALDAVQALMPNKIILVTGAYHELLEKYCNNLQINHLQMVYSENWRLGMGHSLASGVEALDNTNPLLILLADQPRVSAKDLSGMLQLWKENPTQIICASFAGTVGVPAIFPAEFKTALKGCSGDRGAKQILLKHQNRVIPVSMPSAEFDVDTPQDLSQEFFN